MFTLYAIASIGIGLLSYPGYSESQCREEAKRLNEAKTGYHYFCSDSTQAKRAW